LLLELELELELELLLRLLLEEELLELLRLLELLLLELELRLLLELELELLDDENELEDEDDTKVFISTVPISRILVELIAIPTNCSPATVAGLVLVNPPEVVSDIHILAPGVQDQAPFVTVPILCKFTVSSFTPAERARPIPTFPSNPLVFNALPLVWIYR